MTKHLRDAFKKSLIVLIIFFSCPYLVFGAASPTATDLSKVGNSFSSSQQQIAFSKLQENHRAWMGLLEEVFGEPTAVGNTEWAKSIQGIWELTKGEIDQQENESFFGKEFFPMFMQYHQDSMDSILKFMNKDLDGAKASLGKAKADAEQLKRLPMKNKDSVSHLFVDKMVLEIVLCLGVTEYMRGNTETGIAAFRAACDEASKLKWYWGKAQATYYMALYAEWAKLPNADALYQSTLEMAREKRIHYFIWKCCLNLAKFHMEGDGNEELAISFLEEAVISIEFMRTKMEDEDVKKVAFMGPKFEVYRLLTIALLNKGEIRKALEVSEKAKSRVLQELLDSSHGLQLGNAEQYNLVMREQVLSEKIESLEDIKEKDAETQLAALTQEHENVLKEIRRIDPDFGVLKVGGSADADEIQSHLDEKTAFLEYNLMTDCLIAWLVTKNSLRVEKIPINLPTLTQNVQAIRMMMGKPKSPAVYKLLGQLYESIIKPFDKEIQGKNLVIVPDGALHSLPFAALMDAEGKFLVEHHTISIVPSFTVLKHCMAKKKRESKTILAFGNPDLRDSKMDLPNAQLEVESIVEHFTKSEPVLLLRGDTKTNLPNAQTEVKNIAEKFPQSKVYLRKEASETLAKKIMGNFDIIHFACHGESEESGDPLTACLRLAPDETNDGKLTAREIFDLKLNAHLVILSGCETGRGQLLGGDEMIGLTRSFLYAGTPCMMVSLWKVDDSATCLLMSNFYENLAKLGISDALRAAQIKTMETKKHPYYWAAFYLVGDGR